MILCIAVPAAVTAGEVPSPPDVRTVLSLLQDGGVPEDWAGVWSNEMELRTCEDVVISTNTAVDTVCTGDLVDPGDDLDDLDCDFNVDGNTVTMSCDMVIEVDDTCVQNVSWDYTAVLDGDVITATIILETTAEGTGVVCDNLPDSCTKIVMTSTRIGPEPAECATPVETTTWGGIKQQYR